jgi:hypothetical protein
MSVRLQTWFPFPVHIYLNGREWLARQMDGAGIRYRRHDNCFTWVENLERAQKLLNEQLHTNWIQLFDPLVRQVHPLLFSELCVNYPMRYFWTCQDSEWAMDLLFRHSEQLRRLVPRLLHLGVVALSSPDILRFMGKKVTCRGQPCRRPQAAAQQRSESSQQRSADPASLGTKLDQAVRQSLR